MQKRNGLLMTLFLVGLTGCLATTPRAPGEPAPGFNKKGEVIDSSLVEDGTGTTVTGLYNTKGEVFGVPSPGFANLKIGMDFVAAGSAAGMPSSQGTCSSWRYKCTVWIYQGQGRLIFGTSDAGYPVVTRLLKIIHNRKEPATM